VKKQRVKCRWCGKETAGRRLPGGNGEALLPMRHPDPGTGEVCQGSWDDDPEWVHTKKISPAS